MKNSVFCTVTGTVLLFFAASLVNAQEREQGEALRQRFIAHLKANTPVAGEFEVHSIGDPESYARHLEEIDKLNKARGNKGSIQVVPEASDQLLICRWAYDVDREMLETLPGSKNIYKTFYMDRESLVDGFEGNGINRSFNITKPRDIPTYRPANFYFLSGAVRFTEALSTYEMLRVDQPAPGAPNGTVLLICSSPKQKLELRLLLESKTCVLHGAELVYDSRPGWQLKIHELVEGPGQRVFPARAELIHYPLKGGDRPDKIVKMAAKKITFPQSAEETSSAFRLEIPKGAVVADRTLNQGTILDQPTAAQAMLAQPLPSSRPMEETPDIQLPGRSYAKWYWAGGGLCLAIAAALASWVFAQRKSSRHVGR
jgi:hypothetical protein